MTLVIELDQDQRFQSVAQVDIDSCPNPGRVRPPDREGRMGELDDLIV